VIKREDSDIVFFSSKTNSTFESSLMSFSSVSSKPLEDEDDPSQVTQDQYDDANDEEPLDPRIQVRPSFMKMIVSFVEFGCLD
jgi:hypothetical protein